MLRVRAHATAVALAIVVALVVGHGFATQQKIVAAEAAGDGSDADAADERAAAEDAEGIFLPTDRLKQRQLDRARRLIDDGRWSDAATLLDEILGADRDFFFRPDQRQSTWQSIKAETTRLIGSLGQPGREAYQLQFRARADGLLQKAIAAGDAAGVVAVARRWFHTPAGQRATLLAAIDALESNQPLAAAAWLDRLAAADGSESFEPTLSIMRAIAWFRAGDRQAATAILDKARNGRRVGTRIAGKDVTVSFPAGGAIAWLTALAGEPSPLTGRKISEWWMHRGDAARNAIASASRPLLVPRYRVPLTRHPEEARLLEKRRRFFADQETPLFPAGTPLAVDGSILVHTPMGLLAIDFETGKRIWLQTAGASAPPGLAAVNEAGDGDGSDTEGRRFVEGAFEDATSGTMSSDGRLVFVVESDPEAITALNGPGPNGLFRPGQPGLGWKGGNALAAYDVAARGAPRWRLPGRDGGEDDAAAAAKAWYMGAPLPIGDQLFVLVEEKAEIRLDVLDAATGRVEWSQPLAELDEDQAIDNRESHSRRVAGLSPSLAEGVLVCPTGAGAVVAVDLATRTLLWAYNYPRPREGDVVMLPNGVRVRRQIGGGMGGGVIINGQWIDGSRGTTAANRWRDTAPILAAGRVILTPNESDELHCLDLRRGTVLWKAPRKDLLQAAGVFENRVIVVGQRRVDALSLENGRSGWPKPLPLEQGSPSGRGILAEGRLFLPLDTPEVVEIDLAAGRVVDRSPARGGSVPGNLVAYRGEVISQGIDSLDVFHQAAPLENRIETALREEPRDPGGLLWRGQLELDRGRVAAGIGMIREAHAGQPARIPRDVVDAAIAFAMQRDFAAAAPLWREAVGEGAATESARATLRVVVDGFLRSGDFAQAWDAWQLSIPRRTASGGMPPEATPLVDDASDPRVTMTESRWLQGRLADLVDRANPELRGRIDKAAEQSLAEALAAGDPVVRTANLEAFIERFGRHPVAMRARESLASEFDRLLDSPAPRSDAFRDLAVRRDFLRLGLGSRPAGSEAMGGSPNDLGAAWPVGKVIHKRGAAGGGQRRDQNEQEALKLSRMMPISVEGAENAFVPGLRMAWDAQQPGFVATDGFGRRIGEPFGSDGAGRIGGIVPMFNPMGIDASAIGRVVVVRSGPLVAAFELAGRPGEKNRRLWVLSEKSSSVAQFAQLPAMAMGGGRGGRRGRIPLGMRISEPDEPAAAVAAVQGGAVRATGLPIVVNRSLELHDPATGGILWERHRLPTVGEIFGDDQFLCVCPSDGRGAVVLSMADGRTVRTCDLPRREQRLLTSGRRIVTVRPIPEHSSQPVAGRVRLDLFDPVSLEEKPLCECDGGAYAEAAGPDRLAVVEPGGALTVFDLESARTIFRTTLGDMPETFNQLRVIPWQDRYLVFVGRPETAEEQRQLEKVGIISHLPQMVPSREPQQPATGSLWAVDRQSGDLLWPVPATILRHCLYGHQPAELPLLLFVRQIQPTRGGERPRLSVLCLDKRTGHAVYADDKIMVQQHMLFGCDMSGDPATHTITLNRAGGETADLRLEFTGEPMAPRPPHQAAGRPPVSSDLLTELEYWLQRALTIPLPF